MIKKLFVGTFGVALNVIIYILVILFAIRVITWSYDFAYNVFGDKPVAEASEEIVPVQISDGPVQTRLQPFLRRKALSSISKHLLYVLGCLSIKACLNPAIMN